MATTIENSTPATKEAIKNAVGGWREVEKVSIDVNQTIVAFAIPAGAKMAKIQGLIVAPAGLIQPTVTFNNLTTAIYNQLKINTTSAGDQAPDETLNGTGFQFTSSFATSESSLIDIEFPISNVLSRQLFKGIGFNNGGSSGDYHTSVGWAADAADITTVELRTVAPFANGFNAGSFFSLFVLD